MSWQQTEDDPARWARDFLPGAGWSWRW